MTSVEQSSSSSQNFEDYEVNDFDILTIGSKYGLSLHLKQQKGRQIYRYFNTIDGINALETTIDDRRLIVHVGVKKNEEVQQIPYIFRNVDKGNEFVEKMIELLLTEQHNLEKD
tara:strand:+ start:67 stop:408 length:342 start_codon:yes stop_codon:yes gene_type:complete